MKLSNLYLAESVTFRVAGHQDERPPDSVFELGLDIRNKLYRVVPEFNQGTNPERLAQDGLDTEAIEGTLNFYPAGISAAAVPKIVAAIKYFLGEHGVEFGDFIRDKSGLFPGETVYRIPVKLGEQSGAAGPPEINMANVTANVVLNDVLNLGVGLQGQIDARDLLIKIDSTSDSTVRRQVRPSTVEREPGRAAFIDYGIDAERLERHLRGLRALARWALEHHYDEIEWH